MSSVEEFNQRSHRIAKRFLQTAVVVDDQAYIARNGDFGPRSGIVLPGRNTRASLPDEQVTVGRRTSHALDAGSLIDSFAELGVICGVVSPKDTAMDAMRQADIVVLDWRLQEDDPRRALNLLWDLLTGEADRNSLRLVAIYTGEATLEDIRVGICDELKKAKLDPKSAESEMEIQYRHGLVVLYAKSDVNLAPSLQERSVTESNLPARLVQDFSSMTAGLLPSIALTSLTAVREGAHKVLDQFNAELDPAFLAHRACLSHPEDAERQIVNHLAEELRGLMDNDVAETSPAGAAAVEGWIRRRCGGNATFEFGKKNLDLKQTIKLATKGLEKSDLKKNAFEGLTTGFSGKKSDDLEERLAWIMSFRTAYRAPPPTLWLGSVVSVPTVDGEQHLICMRPRCDCVRLRSDTTFFFLPLVAPRSEMVQIVVRANNTFERLGIEFDPAGWVFHQFKPSSENSAVTATRRGPDGEFEFVDTNKAQYKWRGELKAEYAQRIAQILGTTLSRVAVDESEWLRRKARKE